MEWNRQHISTIVYTSLALLAFAGNSLLCRLALAHNAIDPASFSAIRLVSGAVFLVGILLLTDKRKSTSAGIASGSWSSSLALLVYAVAFSFAYVRLETGVGALILFTAVQITMIASGILKGNFPKLHEWLGIGIAFSGFTYLLWPATSAPSLIASLLMILSGIAWGLYTLAGQKGKQPLRDTTYNFVRTLPFVVIISLLMWPSIQVSKQGVLLALASGALASGAGYAIWYMALRNLTALRAAVLQLLVPIIAIMAGVAFAGETLTLKIVISTVVILSGILLMLFVKSNRS